MSAFVTIVLVVGFILYSEHLKALKKRAEAPPAAKPAQLSLALTSEAPNRSRALSQARVTRTPPPNGGVSFEQLLGEIQQLRQTTQQVPGGAVLGTLLGLDALERRANELRRVPSGAATAIASLSRELDFLRPLLQTFFRVREDRDSGNALAAMDLYLTETWAPLRRHLIQAGIGDIGEIIALPQSLQRYRSLSVLQNMNQVSLPGDLVVNPNTWARQAQVIGSMLWNSYPALRQELAQGLGGQPPVGRARPVAGSELQMKLLLSAWLPSLFSDIWATLLLGPSWMFSLIDQSEQEGGSPELYFVGGANNQYTPVPPMGLRIEFVGQLLRRLGYDEEIGILENRWWGCDESTAALQMIVGTRTLRFELADVAAYLAGVAATIVDVPLTSMGGSSLRSIPGIYLSPSGWNRAALHSHGIHEVEVHARNTRGFVVGLMEAWRRSHVAPEQLVRTAARNILGLAAADSEGKDSEIRTGRPSTREMREAIILREVLQPRGARSRPPRRF